MKQEFNFYGLGIAPRIIETLGHLNFERPTPIQHKAIPVVLEGKDLIGVAQTGTGKTMAFGIPSIQLLSQSGARCLILVPTRELALQVEESLIQIAKVFGMKTAVIIGGASMRTQLRALAQNPQILIATPGRLIDLMDQRKVLLHTVRILVLDEADRMLDMGFAPQIEKILRVIPRNRQTLLFSATIPPEIVKIASVHMKFPVQIEIAPSGTAAEGVSHELFIVRREQKRELLGKILAQYRGSVLLFCRTKMSAGKIVRAVRQMGHKASEIHSDRSLPQRREALEGFKNGKYRVLVATDIAARGIDVAGIELVINFDLPEDPENYVHRIGRTGRAELTGHAISFAAPDQRRHVLDIERIIKKALPVSEHAEVASVPYDKPQSVFTFQKKRGMRRPVRRRR